MAILNKITATKEDYLSKISIFLPQMLGQPVSVAPIWIVPPWMRRE